MKGAAHGKVEWRRLGALIEECDERNEDGAFGVDAVRGISISKAVINTKADMAGVSLLPYKLFKPNEFCVVTVTSRNGGKISLARNEEDNTYIVSSSYVVFRVKSDGLMPKYLSLLFGRSEFDRYARFNSWGSAREVFGYADMARVEIPVPPIDVQRNVVETWQGLRKMKEENAKLVEPLLALCRSYLQDCKRKYPMKEIGPYITPHDERNSDLRVKLSQGVANTKVFQSPKQVSANSRADKIVRTGQFAYNRATTRNGEKISIAYREGEDCTVSSAYQVFSVCDEERLNPYFLLLWVSRPEFDRYARYMSKGSAHEFFEYDEMCRVRIPLPPIEAQQAVVDVYRCANEAKRIAEEADRLSREICPALVRWAAEGG